MSKDQIVAAAIDLGSNSLRLLIGFRTKDGLVSLSKKRALIRMASGLSNNFRLSPEIIAQALDTLTSFRTEIDLANVGVLRCCGTETFRRTINLEAFTAPAAKILGVPIEILSGNEEARLCCLGVIYALSDRLTFPCLIVDVGGGSTELILLHSGQSQPIVRSLPLGVAALSERNPPIRHQELGKLTAEIRKLLREAGLPSRPMLVGAGGTASSMATLDQELANHQLDKIRGHFLTRERLDRIYYSLAPLSVEQRKNVRGLEAGREKLIMPGLEIYQEVLATIGCAGMIVSDSGLLEGILLSITKTQGP